MSSKKLEGPSAPTMRRDPYEVLCVSRDSTDQEIKTAYRKLALKVLIVVGIHYPGRFCDRIAGNGNRRDWQSDCLTSNGVFLSFQQLPL
ncbi:hypothetical protein COLO4_31279 [Corchorus olitorius]|uniref:J domain-containing protein n=1 Tax=Corchorus olitorius TaxID=93759 RepID=A0A1R3H4X5_9ROSI|nr:hypothetical protein COLO4_31279 [Corchorus olitorius]